MGEIVKIERHPEHPWLALIDIGDAVPGMEGFFCSYILLRERIAVLDVGPACCQPLVNNGLRALGVRPEEVSYLLTSHIHLDHAGGLGSASRTMPNATVVVHPSGIPHLIDPRRLWEATVQTVGELAGLYGPPEPVESGRIVAAEDGMTLDLGDARLETMMTPGHAPHHISFFERQNSVLMAGELCGVRARKIRRPATPPPLYLDKQLESMELALQLHAATLCHGHFGWEPDADALLKSHREQLLAWRDLVVRGLSDGRSPDSIAAEIIRADSRMSGLATLSPLQQRREMYFVRNAIAGLIWHLERKNQRDT